MCLEVSPVGSVEGGVVGRAECLLSLLGRVSHHLSSAWSSREILPRSLLIAMRLGCSHLVSITTVYLGNNILKVYMGKSIHIVEYCTARVSEIRFLVTSHAVYIFL